jgi:hypothetical protein
VGKTHLAISLAIAAAEHGRRVYYTTLADLISSLEAAQQRWPDFVLNPIPPLRTCGVVLAEASARPASLAH